MKLEDGQTWIVLNSKCHIGQISKEMKEFFNLMNGIVENPSTSFVKQIVHDIERVKANPAKERAYMDMQMKLMKAKEQGIDKGMHLGFMKANFDIALKIASLDQAAGLSEPEIISNLRMIFSDLDEDQFQQIILQLKK